MMEAKFDKISYPQAFVVLFKFLEGLARTHFKSGVEDISQGGHEGSASWPNTLQYLLISYAQRLEILAAIHDLRGI